MDFGGENEAYSVYSDSFQIQTKKFYLRWLEHSSAKTDKLIHLKLDQKFGYQKTVSEKKSNFNWIKKRAKEKDKKQCVP